MPRPAVLPSATCRDVGTLFAIISQLHTLPACAPVNASMAALRLAMHDSASGRIATPFLYDSFIHDSTPVYPGARHGLLTVLTLFSGGLGPEKPQAPELQAGARLGGAPISEDIGNCGRWVSDPERRASTGSDFRFANLRIQCPPGIPARWVATSRPSLRAAKCKIGRTGAESRSPRMRAVPCAAFIVEEPPA
jgi:hypothetical protein